MLLKRCGELQPGMVIAKDVHTRAGLLLLNSGEEVTADSIEKLKNNDVSFVFIKEKKDFEKNLQKLYHIRMRDIRTMKEFSRVRIIKYLEVNSHQE